VDQSGPTVAEVLQSLKEGDPVRALVLSVDTEKKRISFGLKPSYFFDEDLQDESRDNAEDAEAPEGNMVDETQQRGHDMQDPDEEADSVDEEVRLVVSGVSGFSPIIRYYISPRDRMRPPTRQAEWRDSRQSQHSA